MNLTKTPNQFNHPIFGGLTTIVNENNDVFFVSNEVSRILDQENKNLTRRLDEDDIITFTHQDAIAHFPSLDIHSSGLKLITEAGLYDAILNSNKPEAKAFKKWVTSEVLPSIRKTGSYAAKPLTPTEILVQQAIMLDNQAKDIQLLKDKNQEIVHSIEEIKAKQTTIDENFYTISGFASLNKIKVDRTEANRLGKLASNTSKAQGYPTGKAFDSKYGQVGTYHKDILKLTFKI